MKETSTRIFADLAFILLWMLLMLFDPVYRQIGHLWHNVFVFFFKMTSSWKKYNAYNGKLRLVVNEFEELKSFYVDELTKQYKSQGLVPRRETISISFNEACGFVRKRNDKFKLDEWEIERLEKFLDLNEDDTRQYLHIDKIISRLRRSKFTKHMQYELNQTLLTWH